MNSRKFSKINLEIADIVIVLESANRQSTFSLRDKYRPFLTNNMAQSRLTLYFTKPPEIRWEKDILNSDTLDIYTNDGRYIFLYKELGLPPYLTIIADGTLRELDLYYSKQYRSYKQILPFDYPFDERLFISLLAQRNGLLVHACGVKINNKGYLFMGPSGAGKSTLARIFNGNSECCILSDDRVALRNMAEQFFIYGTPWPGQGGFFSNQNVQLEKIFFLRHGDTNRINKVSIQESVLQSILCSFLPLWDGMLMDSALKTMDKLIREIPCFRLGFIPDNSVLDLVKSNL